MESHISVGDALEDTRSGSRLVGRQEGGGETIGGEASHGKIVKVGHYRSASNSDRAE
jgi:hypothetical protein